MKRRILIALGAMFFGAPVAEAQTAGDACGGDYVVKAGDTLAKISRSIYGPGVPIQLLFSANADRLKGRLADLPVGLELRAPCMADQPLDAVRSPQALRSLADRQRAENPTREPARTAALRVVATPEWAPLMDRDDPNGGLVTHLLRAALDGGADVKVDFVSDRGAQVGPLLSDGLYDLSLGWSRADCAGDAASSCARLGWSDPIFETPVRIYVKPENTEMTRADLSNGVICVSDGVSEASLETLGATGSDLRFTRSRSTRDCAALVASGGARAAVSHQWLMSRSIHDAGLDGQVAAHVQAPAQEVLHAVIGARHPKRISILARINRGLAKMRDSGDWFRIVQTHLAREPEAARLRTAALKVDEAG
ncbi:MAG: transporter substrate-binding domain-containing protein [Pseudomonadota bacterium]